MPASKYTPEEKVKALELHEKLGPAEAARQTGIPKNTIASWAQRGGVQTVAVANTAEAVEMAKKVRELAREQLGNELLESARKRLAAMDAEMVIVTKKGDTLTVPVGPSGQRDLSQAVKNLVETERPNSGESANGNGPPVAGEIASFMLGARTAFEVAERHIEAGKQPV